MKPCPYCAHQESATFLTVRTPTILQACSKEEAAKGELIEQKIALCSRCHLGFSTAQAVESYGEYYYLSPSAGMGESQYQNILQLLQKTFKKTDSLLEIGCSEGHLLNQLQQKGFTAIQGIEPGPLAVHAQKLGLKVKQDYFTAGLYPAQSLDGIYLMHVFEHFSAPKELTTELLNILKPGGKIVLEVPHFCAFEPEHLLYLNLPFVEKWAGDFSLEVSDLYFSETVLGLVLTKNGAGPAHIPDAAAIFVRQKQLALELEQRTQDTLQHLMDFLSEARGEEVFWWGAGSSSILYLNLLPKEFLKKITVVDGDERKKGLYIPGNLMPIHSKSLIAGRKLGQVVVASSFFNEIKQSLSTQQTTYEKILNVV